MADFLYNTGAGEVGGGGTPIDWLTVAKHKVMLTSASYVPDRDDDLVDAGGADDAIDHEVSGTGYTGGYGGTGRKALASRTITINKTSDRVEYDAADVVWTAIDAGSSARLLQIVEDHLGTAGNDTETRLVSNHDFVATFNGGDVTALVADLMRMSTV